MIASVRLARASWRATIAAVGLALSCSSELVIADQSTGGVPPTPDASGADDDVVLGQKLAELPQRAIDVLVVIDDGWTMADLQGVVTTNLARLATALEEDFVRADYRVAVVSTSMPHPACDNATVDGGEMQVSSCRERLSEFETTTGLGQADDQSFAGCLEGCRDAAWTTEPLGPDGGPRPWIERDRGRYNFDAQAWPPGEALRCVLPQGIDGCSFGAPLEAMHTALVGTTDPTSPTFGFLRPHAILSVLIVTDKYDCSVNPVVADALGPGGQQWQTNAHGYGALSMCWHAGVACSGDGPSYEECHPVDRDKNGEIINRDFPERQPLLHPVERYIALLEDIRRSKRMLDAEASVHVSVLAGVPVDYPAGNAPLVYIPAADPDPDGLAIAPACMSAAGATALPPVRLRVFAEAFETGSARNLHSICEPDTEASLTAALADVLRNAGPRCFDGCAADATPSDLQLAPDCVVTHRGLDDDLHLVPECSRDEAGRYAWQAGDYVRPVGATACVAYLVDANANADPHDDLSASCRGTGSNLEFAITVAPDHPDSGSTFWAKCRESSTATVDCPG